MLNWLKKGAYKTLSEVLAAIRKEIVSLQPRDTDSIKWTKGLAGMEAHVVNVGGVDNTETTVQEDSVIQTKYVRVKLVNYTETIYTGKYRAVVITGYDDTVDNLVNFANSPTTDLPIFVSDKNKITRDMITANTVVAVLQEAYTTGKETCLAVISGETIAYVAGLFSDYTFCMIDYIYAQYSRFVLSPYGRATVIWKPPIAAGFCLICLGNSNKPEYAGQFKVGYLGESLYLYNGADSTDEYAGYIRTGSSAHYVAKTELIVQDGSICVGLMYNIEGATWSTDVRIASSISTHPWWNTDRAIVYEIARRNNGYITQVHNTGSISVTDRWVS